jgi:hypothetical protein
LGFEAPEAYNSFAAGAPGKIRGVFGHIGGGLGGDFVKKDGFYAGIFEYRGKTPYGVIFVENLLGGNQDTAAQGARDRTGAVHRIYPYGNFGIQFVYNIRHGFSKKKAEPETLGVKVPPVLPFDGS